MGRQMVFLLLLCGVFCSWSFTIPETAGRFDVVISQNGYPVEIANNKCILKKAPFTITLRMDTAMGVLVQASFNSRSFAAAKQGKPMQQIPGMREVAMAEGMFNADKDMMINDYAPSYWYFDSDTDNRFDSITHFERGDMVVGNRNVQQLYDVKNQKVVDINKLNKPIYLVFIKSRWETPEFKTQIEEQRYYLQIEWQ